MERRKRPLSENQIRQNLIDCRNLRVLRPTDPHDIRTERDSFMSVQSEVINGILRRVKFWGIILPGEISLIDTQQIDRICPNCVNSMYANIWSAARPDENGKLWQNLYLLSPNHKYPQPYMGYIDPN